MSAAGAHTLLGCRCVHRLADSWRHCTAEDLSIKIQAFRSLPTTVADHDRRTKIEHDRQSIVQQ